MSRALVVFQTGKEQRDLERKVLAAAFKLSFECGDTDGASLAHKGLCLILQQALYDGDGSSGSVIPASVWSDKQNTAVAATSTVESQQLIEQAQERQRRAEPDNNATTTGVPALDRDALSESECPTESVPILTAEDLAETPREAHVEPVQEAHAEAAQDFNDEASCPTVAIEALGAEDLAAFSVDSMGEMQSTPPASAAGSAAGAGQTGSASASGAGAGTMENAVMASSDAPGAALALLDPREVEEAFAVMEAGFVPASNGAEGQVEDERPDAVTATEPSTPGFPQLDWEEPKPTPAYPKGGEITAALERLTAAMPSESIPAMDDAANQSESISGGKRTAAPGQDTVISQPVMETPRFEAPTPQLENFEGRAQQQKPPPIPAPPPIPPAVPAAQTNTYSGISAAAQTNTNSGISAAAQTNTNSGMPAQGPDAEAPGPLSYLDFGDGDEGSGQPPHDVGASELNDELSDEQQPSPETIAEMFAQAAANPVGATGLPPMPMTPSQMIRTQSFYQILGVNKLSSYEEIHVKFLKLVRRMLQTRYSENNAIRDMREFREVLKAICVAHDILHDPVTRTDYDLRQLGMRGGQSGVETPADAPAEGVVPRTRLMIGELLEIANILDRTELQIALDMHRAEPGLMFGSFLVKAGFLNPEELDSALLGQRLISTGKITVAQFQTAMFRMRDNGPAFFDTLMVEGWLSPSDMLNEIDDGNKNKPPAANGQPEQNAGADQTASAPAPEPIGEGTPPNGGKAFDADEHAAVVAAAKRAESELLKSLESGEDPPAE